MQNSKHCRRNVEEYIVQICETTEWIADFNFRRRLVLASLSFTCAALGLPPVNLTNYRAFKADKSRKSKRGYCSSHYLEPCHFKLLNKNKTTVLCCLTLLLSIQSNSSFQRSTKKLRNISAQWMLVCLGKWDTAPRTSVWGSTVALEGACGDGMPEEMGLMHSSAARSRGTKLIVGSASLGLIPSTISLPPKSLLFLCP